MADTQTRIVLNAVDNTKVAFDSVQGGLGRLSTGAGTLNGALGRLIPLLGAATFTAFIKNSIDSADALNDLSARTGVAVETLAGLQLVATQSDTSLEALGKGLNKLSIFMAENSERAKELGITAKDPAEAFIQLAKVLSETENIGVRNSIANELLGKSYRELLPALLQGNVALAEQIRRGQELNPITADMAKNADLFNDQLAELSLGSKAFGISIAKDILPSISQLIKDMQAAYAEGGLLKSLFIGLGTVGKNLVFGSDYERDIKRLNSTIPVLIAQLNRDLQNTVKPLSFIDRNKTIVEIQFLAREANALRTKLGLDKTANPATSQVTGEDPEVKSTKSNSKTPEQSIREQIALIQQENSLIEQGVGLEDARTIAKLKQQGVTDASIVQLLNLKTITNELETAEKKRADDKLQLLRDEEIFRQGDFLATEAEIELMNEAFEIEQKMLEQEATALASKDKILEGIQKETEELMFQLSISGLSLKAQNEKIDARNVEIALQETLNQLAEQGLGLNEEEIEALRRKYEELAKLGRQVDLTKGKSNELGLTFKSALEDAIVDGKDLGDVLKGLEQDILRILARKTITEPLSKAADDILGSFDFGSIFSDIFSNIFNANGNAFNQSGLVPFANGGIVNQATPFTFANGGKFGVMGEAGPEAIMPLSRGANGKLGVQADMSYGGTQVVVNIIGAASQPQVQQRQDGNGNTSIDVIFDAVKGSLVKDIRSEGNFAQALQGQYGLNRAAGSR